MNNEKREYQGDSTFWNCIIVALYHQRKYALLRKKKALKRVGEKYHRKHRNPRRWIQNSIQIISYIENTRSLYEFRWGVVFKRVTCGKAKLQYSRQQCHNFKRVPASLNAKHFIKSKITRARRKMCEVFSPVTRIHIDNGTWKALQAFKERY